MKLKSITLVVIAVLGFSVFAVNTPQSISSKVRSNDPTILDVVYKVVSDKPTVNVRALAFQDGERSFLKVVRPETFVKDLNGNETAKNIGDNIAANVEHSLSWKVSADWAVDLAKVKFEILCSDQGKLPLDWIKIPGLNGDMDVEITINSHTSNNVENALYWYYANHESDLTLVNGVLTVTNDVSESYSPGLAYICNKMGYDLFLNSHYAVNRCHYIASALRASEFFPDSFCVKGLSYKPGQQCFVGDKAYLVIDISAGMSSESYSISYLDSYPYDGWSDEYKSTKMLFRKIESSKDFYIGVFEVTQFQSKLLGGEGEQVLYALNHPSSDGAQMPFKSFAGKLQKLGFSIELPTQEQYETVLEFGGFSYKDDLNTRISPVGMGFPTQNGLYDVKGGIGEWIQADVPALFYSGQFAFNKARYGVAMWQHTLNQHGAGYRLCLNIIE